MVKQSKSLLSHLMKTSQHKFFQSFNQFLQNKSKVLQIVCLSYYQYLVYLHKTLWFPIILATVFPQIIPVQFSNNTRTFE